jgi:cyclic pyranopterin phosphate synthase
MPPEGVQPKNHNDMLRYEDIASIAETAGKLGFYKIRITGGEPLVKKNIERCISMISCTGFYSDICMTTNGSLLTKKNAIALKQAGLHRITISLDTLDKLKFNEITGGGNIDDVFSGIEAATEAGFQQIKLNMVISDSTRQDDVEQMSSFCTKNKLLLQLINRFSLNDRAQISPTEFITDRPPKCIRCNRIRVTADGYIKSCLFSDNEIKIDLNNIEECIRMSVRGKPQNGVACRNRFMNQIGG